MNVNLGPMLGDDKSEHDKCDSYQAKCSKYTHAQISPQSNMLTLKTAEIITATKIHWEHGTYEDT